MPEEEIEQYLFTYSLNTSMLQKLRQHVKPTETVVSYYRQRGYGVYSPAFVRGRSGTEHAFDLMIVEQDQKVGQQITGRKQNRLKWKPKKALVLGAGPVGLLATAILRLRDLDVHTVATRSMESLKAKLVERTGAHYVNAKEEPLSSMEGKYDIVFEITGSPSVALEAQHLIGTNGVVCYLGIYKMQQDSEDAGRLFTDLVLGNRVHFGSVNAILRSHPLGVDHSTPRID